VGPWLAARFTTLFFTSSAAAETVRFRSTSWPPTPLQHCREMMARRSGLGAPLRLVVYPEAHHAFNLPLEPRRSYGHRLEYSETADRAAWSETVVALRQAFGR